MNNAYEDLDYEQLAKRIKERTTVNELSGCHVFAPASDIEPNPNRALYIKVNNKALSLLRIVWEIHHPEQRPLSQSVQVRHIPFPKCTEKRCINPDHLRLVGEGFTYNVKPKLTE